MATATRPSARMRGTTPRKAKQGTLRNPARGVVDLRHGKSPRPNARKPYYASWYDAVNKRIGGRKAFETLPEATQWIDAMERDNLAAYHRGEPAGATPESKSSAFGAVAEKFVGTLTGTKNTISAYGSNARALIRQFGYDIPIDSIDATDVQQMLHACQEAGLQNGTAKGRLSVLNRIMDYAIGHNPQLRSDNPCRGIRAPRPVERDAYIFTRAELEAAIEHLPEDLQLPVWLAYYGALRVGEVCALRDRQLDLVDGRVRITRVRHADGSEQMHAKNGQVGEWASIPEYALPKLQKLLEANPPKPDGRLFFHVGWRGELKPLTPHTLRRKWKKACAAAGLPAEDICFHDLRHTRATHYAMEGAPSHIIQAQLRHSNLATTERYIKKAQDEQRKQWADRVGDGPADADRAEPRPRPQPQPRERSRVTRNRRVATRKRRVTPRS